jgi:Protein of unknown function (DUF2510)
MEDDVTKAGAGWFPDPADAKTMRFWDGTRWTEQRAPTPAEDENGATTAVWALALACGVAGALAWDAPAIAYFWPLGFGGAGLSAALVARRMKGDTPWWAIVAVIASIVGLVVGGSGHQQLDDVRGQLNNLGS